MCKKYAKFLQKWFNDSIFAKTRFLYGFKGAIYV